MAITDDDVALFAKRETTLADIKAAGWYVYYSSSGRWWFDRATGGVPDHFFLPQWVHELQSAAFRDGVSRVQGEIVRALGIKPAKTLEPKRRAKK